MSSRPPNRCTLGYLCGAVDGGKVAADLLKGHRVDDVLVHPKERRPRFDVHVRADPIEASMSPTFR